MNFKPYQNHLKPAKIQNKESLIGIVCRLFDVTPDELFGRCRNRRMIYARHFFRFCLYTYSDQTLCEVGDGEYDHATILHSIKTVNNLIETDKSYALKANFIIKKIERNQIKFPKR